MVIARFCRKRDTGVETPNLGEPMGALPQSKVGLARPSLETRSEDHHSAKACRAGELSQTTDGYGSAWPRCCKLARYIEHLYVEGSYNECGWELEILEGEMKRLNIGCLGISTRVGRVLGIGPILSDSDSTVIYSGGDEHIHKTNH